MKANFLDNNKLIKILTNKTTKEMVAVFEKINGETRKMKFIINEEAAKKNKKFPNLSMRLVWDLEKKGFRNINVNTLTSLTIGSSKYYSKNTLKNILKLKDLYFSDVPF